MPIGINPINVNERTNNMVAVCATCNARILTSMHGRWFDPVAAVNPVTAFGKAHRCTDKALHTPAVADPRRTVITEEKDI